MRSVSFPGMCSLLPAVQVHLSLGQSKRAVKRCLSLFKGRAIAEQAPGFQIVLLPDHGNRTAGFAASRLGSALWPDSI